MITKNRQAEKSELSFNLFLKTEIKTFKNRLSKNRELRMVLKFIHKGIDIHSGSNRCK